MKRRHLIAAGLLATTMAAVGAAVGARAAEEPVVAVAANMKFAIEAIGAKFAAETGKSVKFAFGASGNFARQIEQGAPFELFLSADEESVFRVADKGLTQDRGALYAIGRLVLFVPKDSPLKADAGLADLRTALGDGRLKRFAVANPDIAHYGKAAKQVLQKQGLWDGIKPMLVLGENVGQTGQFAISGSVQAAMLPYSLALAPELAARGNSVLLPAEWHDPLRQRMVLLKKADATAKQFYAYMRAPAARAILTQFGYGAPDTSE